MKLTISKSYDNVAVFQNFEYIAKDMAINVIVGPSGCGKTTLLRSIAGLTDYSGTIDGFPDKIGYVFQEDRLFPHLTVEKNLEIITFDKEQNEKELKEFGVFDLKNKYPASLSGGEKQRVAIIRAFTALSPLILMDEPFKSLDYQLKFKLAKAVRTHFEQTRQTMILVTHDLEIALYLGDEIAVFSDKPVRLISSFHNEFAGEMLNENSIRTLNWLKASITVP